MVANHAKWDALDETLVCLLPAPFGFLFCQCECARTGKRTENCCTPMPGHADRTLQLREGMGAEETLSFEVLPVRSVETTVFCLVRTVGIQFPPWMWFARLRFWDNFPPTYNQNFFRAELLY